MINEKVFDFRLFTMKYIIQIHNQATSKVDIF